MLTSLNTDNPICLIGSQWSHVNTKCKHSHQCHPIFRFVKFLEVTNVSTVCVFLWCNVNSFVSAANEGCNDYHPMFFTHERAWEEFFCVCIQLLNKTWKEMRATAEDFNKVCVCVCQLEDRRVAVCMFASVNTCVCFRWWRSCVSRSPELWPWNRHHWNSCGSNCAVWATRRSCVCVSLREWARTTSSRLP